MTRKEAERADAAGNLEATRIVHVTNMDKTQIVTLEDLEEIKSLQSLRADEGALRKRKRGTFFSGTVLGLLVAAALTAAVILTMYAHQNRPGSTNSTEREPLTMRSRTMHPRTLFFLILIALLASLPTVRADSYREAFPTVPETRWVGLRLIILPQSKALQHYGYQELYRDTDKEFTPLPYADFVGRVARVVSIEQGSGPNGEKLDEADLQLEGDKKIIHGDVDHGCMTDVASVSDLDAARKRYLGKTLWFSGDHLNTYDPQKDASDLPASAAWRDAFRKISGQAVFRQ